MTAADCIREIKNAAGREMSDEELDDLLSELDRIRRARRADGKFESLEGELLSHAQGLADEARMAAQIERRNALLNIKVFNDALSFVDEVSGTVDAARAVRAMLTGINQPIPGARLSIDARGKSLSAQYLGGMVADLRRDGLLPIFNSRTLDREVARELAELSKTDGRPGISGSDDAARIAKVVDKYRRTAVARENRAGAFIRPLDGYVVRQTHDMHRMRRAGFEEWKSFILPRLDIERTFGGANTEDFLRGAYDGLVTGRHLKSNGGEENDLKLAFKGPGNLAKQVSEHRVLHFRDSDAFMDYNERFGQRSLVEAVIQDLDRAAQNTALMEVLGPNPRAMFDKIMGELKDKNRSDTKISDALASRGIENRFREVSGETKVPVNPSSAFVGAIVRAFQSMAKLGGAVLSGIADIPFKASELRFQGRGIGESYLDSLTSFLEGVAPGDRRATAELLGVALEGQLGDLASRFSAQDSLPGTVAKWQQRFFKLNLLGPWTDANKRGLGLMMSRDLAMKSGKSFDQLDDATRNILNLYRIDGSRWEVVRKAVRKEDDGREYIMPDVVRDLPDEAFSSAIAGKVTSRKLAQARDEIETALRAYYVDRADFAIPTPGAEERAILRQGTAPGTAVGEAVRYIGQFKAFPVTVLTKPVSRELFGQGATTLREAMLQGRGDILGLANMIVGTTIMGYVAQSAKELAKGRTPRDPNSAATWTAAMLQGGGLGIYGDFVFGEFNRFGRSFLDTLAGPTLGSINDLAELWARFRNGEDGASAAVRFGLANAPGANLFYTRAALDYLIFYNFQESLNPGFLRRMERRIEKENAQTFILPPSQVIPRGGQNILEAVQ